MRVTVETAALLDRVTFLASVVERRATILILGHLRITAEDDRLALAATNLDMWAETFLAAETPAEVGTTLDAHLLRKFLAAAPKGSQTTIETGDGTATITAGPASLEVGTLPVEDWPEVTAWSATAELREVDADTFSDALLAANVAASKEEVKYYLNGVYIDGGHAVATDGNRLICVDHPSAVGGSILPAEMVPLIADLLRQGGRFGSDDRAWRAEAGDKALRGKCVDASYPDWKRVTNTAEPSILVGRDDLRDALARAMIGADEIDRSRAIKIVAVPGCPLVLSPAIRPGDGKVRGGASETPAEIAKAAEFGVNGRYLREVLSAMPDAEIAIAPPDQGGPLRIQPADGSAFMGRYGVIAPMRVT